MSLSRSACKQKQLAASAHSTHHKGATVSPLGQRECVITAKGCRQARLNGCQHGGQDAGHGHRLDLQASATEGPWQAMRECSSASSGARASGPRISSRATNHFVCHRRWGLRGRRLHLGIPLPQAGVELLVASAEWQGPGEGAQGWPIDVGSCALDVGSGASCSPPHANAWPPTARPGAAGQRLKAATRPATCPTC